MKRHSIIKILKVEGMFVEVMEMVAMVKATVMKGTIRRRNSRANQIGVEEDVVEEEAADQITPTSSSTDVANMVTMRRIATPKKCYNCGKVGHFEKYCQADIKIEETTNLALEDERNEGVLLMAQNEVNINNDTLWYLDSGASNHICGHEYLFKEMQKIEDDHLSFGDASKVEVKGRGTVCYLQKDGLIVSLQDVYYVLDLKTNILSMGQLTEKGYSIFLKDRLLHLKNKQRHLVARIEMER